MEGARDLAKQMQAQGFGTVLDQFNNLDNPLAHFEGTGPEIWRDTQGQVTHFISSMGTTGTIMGVSAYLKTQSPEIQIIGLQPKDGASIPGIRRWPQAYMPGIFDAAKVDSILDISQKMPCADWPKKRVFSVVFPQVDRWLLLWISIKK